MSDRPISADDPVVRETFREVAKITGQALAVSIWEALADSQAKRAADLMRELPRPQRRRVEALFFSLTVIGQDGGHR